eukprot:CAMPEP_0115852978 /NCGR_PEP_ID=MMETSP0287-20121206/13270_1 /TAXON_ID=412157 /ORGANISM="Chrysochromulina rotalis, Strain UIO044" /LENGTH=111 /DNA_ID=CAMNT_0003307047 /DNA_START=647 /DNA_END=980 /DNA_ORIENTATION=+
MLNEARASDKEGAIREQEERPSAVESSYGRASYTAKATPPVTWSSASCIALTGGAPTKMRRRPCVGNGSGSAESRLCSIGNWVKPAKLAPTGISAASRSSAFRIGSTEGSE